jgi:hypothetical protein
MIYGTVVEYVDMSIDEMQRILSTAERGEAAIKDTCPVLTSRSTAIEQGIRG